MNCHGHTGSAPVMAPPPQQSEAGSPHDGVRRTPWTAIFSPPFSARKFMPGRKLVDEKLMCSWWATMPPPFETLEIPELVEDEWDALFSEHRLFLQRAILPAPPVGVWSEGRASWPCCSWSSFLLRKGPPGPRTRFIAWRCRDSWRYSWEEKKIFTQWYYIPEKYPNWIIDC